MTDRHLSDENAANLIAAFALAVVDDLSAAVGSLVPSGIPSSAIALIGHAPWITVAELAGALGLSHSATVRLVDRMSAVNLVERRRSKTDARAVLLSLTETGHDLAEQISASRLRSVEPLLSNLSQKERRTFANLTKKALEGSPRDGNHAVRICRLCEPIVCENCPVEPMLPLR